MTVQELINELKKFPTSKQVCIYNQYTDTYTSIHSIYYQVDSVLLEPVIAIDIC